MLLRGPYLKIMGPPLVYRDICTVVGWSSLSTFNRFYSLDVPALQTPGLGMAAECYETLSVLILFGYATVCIAPMSLSYMDSSDEPELPLLGFKRPLQVPSLRFARILQVRCSMAWWDMNPRVFAIPNAKWIVLKENDNVTHVTPVSGIRVLTYFWNTVKKSNYRK